MRRRGIASLAVYPRVCGGTDDGADMPDGDEGLSPRVRGNHRTWLPLIWSLRSIPACAGEPVPVRNGANSLRVYPRVCGGTRRAIDGRAGGQGLSPRVRGNPTGEWQHSIPSISIPACAGEPHLGVATQRLSRVYPRVCGGTMCWPPATRRRPGLSPRVRGNPVRTLPAGQPARSIPACAGEPYAGRRM